jgi:hypothetical protein
MALPEKIELTRDEALDVLAALEGAAHLLAGTDFVATLLGIEDAAAIMSQKLWLL